jgi:hypothetical protein
MTPHRPLGVGSPTSKSPLSVSSSNSATDHTGRRLPGGGYSQSEKFKNAESNFLSSSSPREGKGTPKRSPLSDKDELERFLADHTKLGLDDSPTSMATLSVDEKQSTSFPSLASPPVSSRTHARRPSYMQATSVELKRQQELKEQQTSRESRKLEEQAKSTRRVAGKTNTDLYQAQQADLEARRLAQLALEEQERKAERAKFIARFAEAQSQPAEISTPRLRPAQIKSDSSYASGSQTSRSPAAQPSHTHTLHTPTSSSPSLAPSSSHHTSSSSALLEHELQKRERVVLADTLGEAKSEDVEEEEEELEEGEDEDSDDDIDDETRANTLANSSKAPNSRFVLTQKAPAPPTPLTSAPIDSSSSLDAPPSLAAKRGTTPSSVSQLYDPSVARLQARHEGGGEGRTGLDFLLESTRVKKRIKNKKVKLGVANIHTGFGRMTEAQIERSMDALEKKRQMEAAQSSAPKPLGYGAGGGGHGHHHTSSATPADSPGMTSPAQVKRSFFPSLWKKITGT